MRFVINLAVACVMASGLAACGVTNPSDLTTESFSGSIAPGGQSDTFRFTTSKTGEFVVKITALAPDNGATLTISYGTFANINGVIGCNLIQSLPGGYQKSAFDQQLPKGDYCLQVNDPSVALPQTESFTIAVSHL